MLNGPLGNRGSIFALGDLFILRNRINIRLVATPEKLSNSVKAQLEQLDATLFPEDQAYPKDGCYWWIAYMDHKPIAFAGLKPLPEPNRDIGFLCRAGVMAVASGYGLQRRLIKLRLCKARQLKLTEVITYTDKANHRSAANLLRCGLHFYTPRNEWGISGALYFHQFL